MALFYITLCLLINTGRSLEVVGTLLSTKYFYVIYHESPRFLPAVTPEKPSGIFRTGWSTKEDMVGCPVVQLGVALETYETVANLEMMHSGVDDRHAFAHKIAKDLFLFMTSFSQTTPMGDMMASFHSFPLSCIRNIGD